VSSCILIWISCILIWISYILIKISCILIVSSSILKRGAFPLTSQWHNRLVFSLLQPLTVLNKNHASELYFIIHLGVNLYSYHGLLSHKLSTPLERFHSRGQQPCKFFGTKESFYIRKEFNSQRISVKHQHGRRFIVLEHQYGCRDVIVWSDSTQLYMNNGGTMRLSRECFKEMTRLIMLKK